MTKFTYIITKPTGMDAHLASRLVKTAESLDSTIALHKAGGGAAVATNLMALLGIDLKPGDAVEVTVGFGAETDNAAILEQFFRDNL